MVQQIGTPNSITFVFFVSPLTPPMSHLTPSEMDGLILIIVSLPVSG